MKQRTPMCLQLLSEFAAGFDDTLPSQLSWFKSDPRIGLNRVTWTLDRGCSLPGRT